MDFNHQSPIYMQIADHFKRRIVSGEYQPGQRIDSVRDLAFTIGVNPNTMQRALSELEHEGYVYSERTSGRFITRDAQMIRQLQKEIKKDIIREFLDEMYALGFTNEQIIECLKRYLGEEI